MRRHYDELAGRDADDLAGEFVELAGFTVNVLARMAAIIKIADERDDLARYRDAYGERIVGSLLDIASGQLDPLAYLKFGHRHRVLQKVKRLPVPEQRRIAANDNDAAATAPAYGTRAETVVVPDDADRQQAKVEIREERIQAMRRHYREKLESSPEPGPNADVRLDYERCGLWVGKKFIQAKWLEIYLERLWDSWFSTDDGDEVDDAAPVG